MSLSAEKESPGKRGLRLVRGHARALAQGGSPRQPHQSDQLELEAVVDENQGETAMLLRS
jgi:hypothetical protein